MKKMIALGLVILMAVCAVTGLAEAAEGRTLREGKYIIGEDIKAGTYILTCVETAGEAMNDAYGALGSMLDSMDGSQDYGSMFGAFGGMFEEYMGMTVEIVGDYGDVLKTCTMKNGDTVSIVLKEGTALKITDGSCTISPEK